MDNRLVVALASTALAVAVLGLTPVAGAVQELVVPARSVGTAQLKDGAVTSTKVRNGSLVVADFKRGQLPAGPTGPAGPKGDPGPAGITGVETVIASSSFDSANEKTLVVRCPDGKRLLAGGAGAWGRAMIWVTDGVTLTASQPLDDGAWLAAAQEVTPTEESWFIRGSAVCAAVAG
jgi:hypothetical protein